MDVTQLLAVLKLLNSLAGAPEAGAAPAAAERSLASVGDAGEAALRCYHPTGRFRQAEVVADRWAGAGMYNARRSAVIRVAWNGGFVGSPYVTDIALMERDGMVRTYVVADTAVVPPNRNCRMEAWVRPRQ